MRLNAQVFAGKGGVVAHAGHGRKALDAQPGPGRVRAGRRQLDRGRRQIGRGKTQFVAAPLPLDDNAAHAVRPAKQGRGAGHVAGADQMPDAGGADRRPVREHRAELFAGKGELLAQPAENRAGAGAGLAQGKIIADQQMPHVQALQQHLADKILRLHGGQLMGEGEQQHGVHAAVLQQFQPGGRVGQPGRRQAGRQNFQRMRLKRDRDQGPAACACQAPGPAEQSAVPDVHAVEVADGRAGAAFLKRARPGERLKAGAQLFRRGGYIHQLFASHSATRAASSGRSQLFHIARMCS